MALWIVMWSLFSAGLGALALPYANSFKDKKLRMWNVLSVVGMVICANGMAWGLIIAQRAYEFMFGVTTNQVVQTAGSLLMFISMPVIGLGLYMWAGEKALDRQKQVEREEYLVRRLPRI